MRRTHHHAFDDSLTPDTRELALRLQLLFLVLIHEALDAAFGVEQLMFASVKRMAIGANLHLDVRFRSTRLNDVAASALNGGFGINGMDALSHKITFQILELFRVTNPKA
jgi:hypothetical protein